MAPRTSMLAAAGLATGVYIALFLSSAGVSNGQIPRQRLWI